MNRNFLFGKVKLFLRLVAKIGRPEGESLGELACIAWSWRQAAATAKTQTCCPTLAACGWHVRNGYPHSIGSNYISIGQLEFDGVDQMEATSTVGG